MSTEAAPTTERPEIKHDDPKFAGRLVPWYRALVEEFTVASRAAREANKPPPREYSFPVPEDQHGRDLFVVNLLDALERSLANQTAHPMTPKDIRAVRFLASHIVPFKAVESDSFPSLLRLRVAVNERLIRAGLVEALACIARAQLKRGKAISAAQNFGRMVLVRNGRTEVKDLDPVTWSDVMGQRVINEDDKSNTPEIVARNQQLYEKLFAQSADTAQPVLTRIFEIFNRTVDSFVQNMFPRDPEYLRVQWFNILLRNLDRLNQRDDVENIAVAFAKVADRLEAVKDAKGFMGVINTINVIPA